MTTLARRIAETSATDCGMVGRPVTNGLTQARNAATIALTDEGNEVITPEAVTCASVSVHKRSGCLSRRWTA